MEVPASPAPPSPPAVGAEAPASVGLSSSPVAVVWCRQVDNEAESPGYTTVPEEFPGHRETLEAIRHVGHLTVNVADTQDYWDPDPSQPLSYYPNIFLYPAYGGRYTCVGRMFLSTEDRPRLGMKTVVLDTAQLLASHEFGPTILKWHASMGGPRPGGRLPPVPDGALFPIVGEGFLFQRGTTDPVVLVASEQWEPTVQAILEMIRVLPAALIAPAAFLAFPYFLPAAKTDLKEFTEQLPLALAVMRVGRGEAAGERHGKRIAAWESATTVRDLTDGLPTAAKGKESVPLVLQYIRDRNDSKILPISERVDLVELPRLRQRLADPDRSAGKDRRKEMWRIGTAMESAALLLAKARGRHVPVNMETAKRAQEYVQARLPPRAGVEVSDAEASDAPFSPPAAESPLPEPAAAGLHPPWLQRSETVAPVRVDRVEVVPISHSDDPSLLPAAARPADPANVIATSSTAPGAPVPASFRAVEPPAGPAVDPVALKAEIERNVARWVEGRLAQITAPPPEPSAEALGDEIDRRVARSVDERLAKLPAPPPPIDVAALEARLTARFEASLADAQRRFAAAQEEARASSGRLTDGLASAREGFEQRLAQLAADQRRDAQSLSESLSQRLSNLEGRLSGTETGLATLGTAQASASRATPSPQELQDRITAASDAAVQRQLDAAVRARLAEAQRSLDASLKSARDETSTQLAQELNRLGDQLRVQIAAAEEDLRQGLSAQVDLHLREASGRELGSRTEIETRFSDALARRLQEDEGKRARQLQESEQRVAQLVDAKLRELEARLPTTIVGPSSKVPALVEARVAELEGRLVARQEAQATELRDGQNAAAADLQVRLQAYFDQRLRESAERQRETAVELLARMKSEVDASLVNLADAPKVQQALQLHAARLVEADRAARDRLVDERVHEAESRLRGDFLAAVHRLELVEQTFEARGKELREIETSIRADLVEVDRRTQILSDRLVPVVRKTWLKIGELEKGGSGADTGSQLLSARREFQRELRRIEGELAARDAALRDRMETAIANQGRVWLTLIRQLSQLTGDRRPAPRLEELRLPAAPPEPAPAEPLEGNDLDDLPALLQRRGRSAPSPAPAELEGLDEEVEEPVPRRRRRPTGRSSSS